MSKIEESYEEQVRKEFESTQPKEEVKETVTSDLGKVSLSVPQGLVKSESFQLSMRKTLKTSGIR